MLRRTLFRSGLSAFALGAGFNPAGLKLPAEADKPAQPVPQFRRPDGSFTNW